MDFEQKLDSAFDSSQVPLQVALRSPNGDYVEDQNLIVKALLGSPYKLDKKQTVLNAGQTMITVKTEQEAERLMELGEVLLPSGYSMEIEVP